RSSLMAVNIHITIIELNALHTKRQNLFQELDAVIHLLMEAKHWGLRKSRNATSLNSRFKSLDTLKVKIISVTFRRVIRTNHKIAEGQWYRYAPSYVSPAYHLLEGFPFIQEPPSGDLQERVLIRHHDYDQCFQSVQLLQWNSQVKFNVTVYRNLPTTRDSIMTS